MLASVEHEKHIAAGLKALHDLRVHDWRIVKVCRRYMESCYLRNCFKHPRLLPRYRCCGANHK